MPVRQRSVRDGGTGQVVVSPRAQPLALQAIWGAARTHTGAGGARPALSSWGPPLPDSCPGLLEVGSSPQFLPEVCPSPPGVPLPQRWLAQEAAGCSLVALFSYVILTVIFFPHAKSMSPPLLLSWGLCVAASVNFLAMGSLWWLGSPVWCVGLGCLWSQEQLSQGTQPGFADSQVLPAEEPCLAKCRHGVCSEDPAWTLGLGCGPGSPVGVPSGGRASHQLLRLF